MAGEGEWPAGDALPLPLPSPVLGESPASAPFAADCELPVVGGGGQPAGNSDPPPHSTQPGAGVPQQMEQLSTALLSGRFAARIANVWRARTWWLAM